MIPAELFLEKAREIAAEKPAYRKGGSGGDGTCDCIGLVIGAVRRAGGSWPGLHGSNYAARNEAEGLRPAASSGALRAGTLVFRARSPGEPGYDEKVMSTRYASSPDRRDYYHVGVVTSVRPLEILHMTSPSVRTDVSLRGWDYTGWLKRIGRPEEEKAGTSGGGEGGDGMEETVRIGGGNLSRGIHFRSAAGKHGAILGEIPQDSRAALLEWGESWCGIRYGGRTGYVMTEFVQREGEAPEEEKIAVSRARLAEIYDELGDLLGLRG